jgi:hypothetical protein
VPHAAIKLAPATKTPSEWANQCELEWISSGDECRQLVAWHGNLAEHRGQHRATILTAPCGLASAAKSEQGEAIRSVAGDSNVPIPITRKLCRYIFDVDPAVLAARLKGALAAVHNLQSLDTGGAYLTGDSPVYDPALVCFHVDDIVPMRTPRLAKHLRDRHIGQLEIKKSGVDIVPEKLRRELKLRGDSSATLLIAKLAGRPTAILAHRCDSIR